MNKDAIINKALSKQLGTVVSLHEEQKLAAENTFSGKTKSTAKKLKRVSKRLLLGNRWGALLLPKGFRTFSVGQQGNFPYYWQDPSNLSFNARTYKWISSGVKIKSQAVSLNGVFINRYLQMISKINYVLSTSDQVRLNEIYQRSSNEQRRLLVAWKQVFGSIPRAVDGVQPITQILGKITTEWADPATNISALRKANDFRETLNKVPEGAGEIVTKLGKFLAATEDQSELLEKVVRNNGDLARAIEAIQTPDAANGAIVTSLHQMQPAINILTDVDDIEAGLANTNPSSEIELSFQSHVDAYGDVNFKLAGKTIPDLAPAELLSIETVDKMDDNAQRETSETGGSEDDPFATETTRAAIGVTASAQSEISFSFSGATVVEFEIPAFEAETGKNWYWLQPLLDAQANCEADVSGFKFGHEPKIDFSEDGQFGFVKSVIISRLPSIKVITTEEHVKKLKQEFDQTNGRSLNALGQNLGQIEEKGGYSAAFHDGAAEQLILSPPPQKYAKPNMASRAFVLGCEVVFPLSKKAV